MRASTTVTAVCWSLLLPSAAFACTCFDFAPLDQVVKISPSVVVGRVVAVGGPRGQAPYDDPTHVEIDVLRTVKGPTLSGRIKVWNELAATTCGGALKDIPVTARAVLAIRRTDDSNSVDSLWTATLSHITIDAPGPAPSDFLLRHAACAESLKVLTTPAEVTEWMERTIRE